MLTRQKRASPFFSNFIRVNHVHIIGMFKRALDYSHCPHAR